MFEVPLPDSLYRQAALAAQAHNLSVEAYVAEAVQLHLQDDPEEMDQRFTPAVIEHLDRIAESRGKLYSAGEVDRLLGENKAEWLAKRPS